MTTEEQTIFDAASRFVVSVSAGASTAVQHRRLGELVTCVYNLPLVQWPENACPPRWSPDCCDEDLSGVKG